MIVSQLIQILPYARARAAAFIEPLNNAMAEFGITTPLRQAAFIAQIGHESGQLRYVEELASGAAYDTGPLAARLGNTPEADGDGQRWKGHGLIQVTGAANHARCAAYFHITLDAIVAWLMTPVGACRSAGWYWANNGLNTLADKGDMLTITKRINGGTNGLAERLALYDRARAVLAAAKP